jgi:hypothetical protein
MNQKSSVIQILKSVQRVLTSDTDRGSCRHTLCAIDSRSELLRRFAEQPRKLTFPALAKLQLAEALAQYILVSLVFQPSFSPPKTG